MCWRPTKTERAFLCKLSYLGLVFLLVGLTACGGTRFLPLASVPSEPCVVDAGEPSAPNPIRVLQPDGYEAATWYPVPLFSRQTLIMVDCEGVFGEGLAVGWHGLSNGVGWRFRLDEENAYDDNGALKAADVVRMWQPLLATSTMLDSVVATDAFVLDVYARPGFRDSPIWLAANEYSLRERVPHKSESERNIQSIPQEKKDIRDLLVADVDVVVTEDPDVIAYARQDRDLVVHALPWQKTYTVVLPPHMHAEDASDPLPGGVLHRLSSDAVQGDTRAHTNGMWWDDAVSCAGRIPIEVGTSAKGALTHIYFNANDPTARDLAERLATLASADKRMLPDAAYIQDLFKNDQRVLATGLTEGVFATRLAASGHDAFIVRVPLHPIDACEAMTALKKHMPWISAKSRQGLVPLVDARAHLIARRGVGQLHIDWFGNVQFVLPEWIKP